jgi:outer membrane receptor for ferrienterochelin and colicin
MKSACRLLLFAVVFFALSGHAQSTFRLSGKLLAEDFNPLYNASVYLAKFSTGTFTDSAGEFTLNLKPGANEISFSYIGYRAITVNLFMARDTAIEVQMKADLQMTEVVIVDKAKLRSADHDESGTITLRKENFLAVPALLGENDPIRAVQMQPGVQSGNEGASGIFVRGGSPDQNLILLDGTPVFNPSHIYGFVSVFNGDAIDKLDVYTDAYPARFGSRLGSVMDIDVDPGNANRIQGSASIGVITSRVHLEGPLDKKHATTFAVSVRGCYVGLFTGPISEQQYKAAGYNGDIGYYFDDINIKVAHQFSAKDRIEWSYFSNNDFYNFTRQNSSSSNATTDVIKETDMTSQTLTWGNYVSSLVWKHTFNDRWSMKTSLAFSDYNNLSKTQSDYEENYITYGYDYKDDYGTSLLSFIEQLSLKSDVAYKAGALQTFRMGAELTGMNFQTGKGDDTELYGVNKYTTQQSPSDNLFVRSIQSVAYFEDDIRPTDNWQLNCGFHANQYTVPGKTFVTFLPRVNAAFSPVKNFTIRASVSGTSQNLHLLTTLSTDILSDNYVPAIASAPPETGWNYSGGVIQKLPLNFEWSVDGFYRSMTNLIDYKSGADYSFLNSSWNQQIATGGKGKAYGLETYVARNFGRLTGSIAYTLAWSDRKFTDLNNGDWYPYKYDRRHDVAAQLNFLVNKHIELGSVWVYGSGNMVTLPVQYYNSWNAVSSYNGGVQAGYPNPQQGEELPVYTGKNGYRLPSYQHLDLSFIYKMKVKKLEHLFNVSIYNVYDHFNVFAVYQSSGIDASGNSVTSYKMLSLFPILPSFSYTVKFGV